MPLPFEVTFDELKRNLDMYVDEVFACLQSEFLVMPRGPGFVEYPIFDEAYEALKKETSGFRDLAPGKVSDLVFQRPITLIVLRAILGFTPSELAYAATRRVGIEVTQNAARSIDRKIRMGPATGLKRNGGLTEKRVMALVQAACEMIKEGAPSVPAEKLHRLDKADTKQGLTSMQPLAQLGVPYSMLLYERFLGRPFAGHRDSVSELVGDILETAIDEVLSRAGITYRKTKRAERIDKFDQAPDFIVPSEFNPQVVIEAKLTEDDGTARDKVTRVQHLATLSMQRQPQFEVVACIAGRGFGVRREDMRKLLLATRGKVFTLENINRLVDYTDLKRLRTRPP